mgnify:CR=1 FL=1
MENPRSFPLDHSRFKARNETSLHAEGSVKWYIYSGLYTRPGFIVCVTMSSQCVTLCSLFYLTRIWLPSLLVTYFRSFSIRLYQSLCSFSIRLYQSLYFCSNLILLTILKPTLSSHCPSLAHLRRIPIRRHCKIIQCHRLTVATFTNVANKLQLQLPASRFLLAVMLLLWSISLVCS